MSKLILKAVIGVALVFGLTAQPSGYGFAQDAVKGEPKSRAKSASTKAGDTKQDATAEPRAKKPLTAQQQKMKDCGAKWQEEKKAKGVKGREAWNKFRSVCLKS